MVKFPFKRTFGLIGSPRAGKDTVAKFLQETRGFDMLAFADQVKDEFGVSKEDFESAKLSNKIEELREELWQFSSEKTKSNPYYFIGPVLDKAESSENSVVITDIRTELELSAFFGKFGPNPGTKAYKIGNDMEKTEEDYRLSGTKISRDFFWAMYFQTNQIHSIDNRKNGLFQFLKELDRYFFKEDVMDLVGPSDSYLKLKNLSPNQWEAVVHSYLDQFEIAER